MTFEDIQEIIAKDEHRCLELKKTTGELQDGMHSACAFLNTEGGLLIFGVAPTSLKILGQQVTDSTQREIAQALAGLYPAVEVKPEYIDVPGRNGDQLIVMHFSGWRWGQMPYTYRGCPYYKNESTTQVMPQEMYEERLRAAKPEKFAWERQEAEGVALADLDEKRIRGAVRLGVERGRMPATAEAESVESLLSKWNLMRDGKVLNGAVALFGKNLSGYTQMSLRLARFRGTDKNEFVDSGRADGNFFDLLDAGMAFLFKHLSQSGKIVGFQKEEHLEIPAEALREALTNALCHRQLEKYNLTPSIAVYDDRVEIENPGRLPFDLTPETIKSAHASYPYNPLIAEVLFKSSFLESWGSGVGRMVDACRAQGVPEPEYEVAGGFVRMIFRKRIAASGLIQEEDRSKQGVSWEEVGSKLGVSWEEVEKLIVALQNPMLLNDLKELYGWKNASKFKEKYINPLIAEGLADMTVPNKPTSPNQKYCLTEKGKGLLANKISVKQAEGVSDERVNRLIAEFADALPRFEINLPEMEKQYEATLPIADVRCFQAAYKMKKEMFADNGAWIYKTPELYLTEIQTNIWQHYNVQFLMHRADATYKIRFSEIKAALKALGVDGRYAVITSFYLGTYDALYGGEVALKETDYGYQYGEVPIYRVPSHEDRLIVMRKELLPRCEAKVFEGPSKEYRLINEQHLLYSNLFNMKDEGDGLGLAMMRDIKFYLPEDKDFHYVKFMVDRMERVESELGRIKSL
jgi:ATP-dependent DNA helicase RecG